MDKVDKMDKIQAARRKSKTQDARCEMVGLRRVEMDLFSVQTRHKSCPERLVSPSNETPQLGISRTIRRSPSRPSHASCLPRHG